MRLRATRMFSCNSLEHQFDKRFQTNILELTTLCSGPGGRRFKSSLPDQLFPQAIRSICRDPEFGISTIWVDLGQSADSAEPQCSKNERDHRIIVGGLSGRISGSPAANHGLASSALLMFVSAFCKFETDRPTAAFRTIVPLRPVRPCCSDPIAMMR